MAKNSATFTANVKDLMPRRLGRSNQLSSTNSTKRGIVTFLTFFLIYNYTLTYRVIKTKYKNGLKPIIIVPEKQTFANNQQEQSPKTLIS